MTKGVDWIGKDIFRWGPAPIRAFYTGDFMEGIFNKAHMQAFYPGISWPRGFALYKEGKMVFAQDFSELRRHGLEAFKRLMLPEKERKLVYQRWLEDLAVLEKVEKEINKTKISSISDKDLLMIWKKLHSATINFWTHITIPELANYGSLPLLEEKLRRYVKSEEDLHSAMEILTAPENSSFYQIEEIDLVETEDIEEHKKRYFWIRNSYESVEIANQEFFIKRKKELPKNLREIIRKKQEDTKKRKADLKNEYGLSSEVIDIAEAIVAGIEWQDTRKKDIWIYLHYKNLLLKEMCRRYNFILDDLLNFRELEIADFLENKIDIKSEIENRKKAVGFLCMNGEVKKLDSETTLRYWDLYAEEKVSEKTDSVKGTVASKGKNKSVQGKVRIVLNPKNSPDIKEGEILVTSMTTPEYIFLMKKAVAIVTDAGGLTSHAAIVSRELGVPCIVGTKVATKVFKDGDMIEINSEKGTVRKLQR